MRIFVGNLPYKFTVDDLEDLFVPFGEVSDCFLIKDKITKKFKGYGFVDINNEECALKAIKLMDQQLVGGRRINVAKSKPKTIVNDSSREKVWKD